jgi:hypothetical protein
MLINILVTLNKNNSMLSEYYYHYQKEQKEGRLIEQTFIFVL